jgi:hypothetical protein
MDKDDARETGMEIGNPEDERGVEKKAARMTKVIQKKTRRLSLKQLAKKNHKLTDLIQKKKTLKRKMTQEEIVLERQEVDCPAQEEILTIERRELARKKER